MTLQQYIDDLIQGTPLRNAAITALACDEYQLTDSLQVARVVGERRRTLRGAR